MNTRACLVIAVLGGCGDDGATAVDAAMPDAPWMCPAQTAMPLPPGMNKYFLSFEGVALTPGPDDARTNTSSIVGMSTTVPAFRVGAADRQAQIDQIIGFVSRALAPYSLDVVTTRPSDGEYWMSPVGGSSATIVGTANVLSVAPGVCDADNRNGVSLVFETPGMSSEGYAISILSDFGAMLGLATTAQAGDCLCRMDNCAPTNTVLCTYGADVATGGPKTCGRATQNEPMILAGVLGCR